MCQHKTLFLISFILSHVFISWTGCHSCFKMLQRLRDLKTRLKSVFVGFLIILKDWRCILLRDFSIDWETLTLRCGNTIGLWKDPWVIVYGFCISVCELCGWTLKHLNTESCDRKYANRSLPIYWWNTKDKTNFKMNFSKIR